MTIKQLSEITGISINTLYSITKRDTETPDIEILKKISAALDVPLESIAPFEQVTRQLSKYMKLNYKLEVSLKNELYNIIDNMNTEQLCKLASYAIKLQKESVSEHPNHLEVNAAHERTDIDVDNEMIKHDNDIMDNF